jgi:hypothetical protein
MGIESNQLANSMEDDFRSLIRVRGYELDTRGFSWVDAYLEDLRLRREIKTAEEEITRIAALPIHVKELKTDFLQALEGFKAHRLAVMKEMLQKVQNQEGPMFQAGTLSTVRAAKLLAFDLSPDEIEFLFEDLEQGTSRADKDRQTTKLQKKIADNKARIEKEFSPRERWFHQPTGVAIQYPRGCRWTRFVNDWSYVARRYSDPVTIDGYLLTTEAETRAYEALGLGNLSKLTPIKPGMDRNRK